MYKYLFEKFWFSHWYEKFGMVAVTACLLIVFIALFFIFPFVMVSLLGLFAILTLSFLLLYIIFDDNDYDF